MVSGMGALLRGGHRAVLVNQDVIQGLLAEKRHLCEVKHPFCSQPQNSISRLRMSKDVCKNQNRAKTSPEAHHHLRGAQKHLGAALRTCQGSVHPSLILTLQSKCHFFFIPLGSRKEVRCEKARRLVKNHSDDLQVSL